MENVKKIRGKGMGSFRGWSWDTIFIQSWEGSHPLVTFE